MISTAVAATSKTIAVWILKITLASAPANPTYYEFLSFEDCHAVEPAIHQLYLGLGEKSVTTECSPSEEREVLPLPTKMILSL